MGQSHSKDEKRHDKRRLEEATKRPESAGTQSCDPPDTPVAPRLRRDNARVVESTANECLSSSASREAPVNNSASETTTPRPPPPDLSDGKETQSRADPPSLPVPPQIEIIGRILAGFSSRARLEQDSARAEESTANEDLSSSSSREPHSASGKNSPPVSTTRTHYLKESEGPYVEQQRSLSYKEWKAHKRRERETRKRDREGRKEYAEDRLSRYKLFMRQPQRRLREHEEEKKRLEQQISITTSEQFRVRLQEELRETEKSIEDEKQKVEYWQGLLKSFEKNLHQVEEEEEEEVAEGFVTKALCSKKKIKQRNVVVLTTGLMGAGKTSLLCRLFGMELPKEYTSTGLADEAFRCLTRKIAKLCAFDLLTRDRILEALTPLIEMGVSEAKVEALAEQLVPDPVDTPSVKTLAKKVDKAKEIEVARGDEKEGHAENVKESKEEVEFGLINMIDTGGQPECLEVMPSFIHSSDLTILVLDLSRGLENKVEPTFHKDGKPFRKKHLPRTNKEIIEQVVRTMQAKRKKKGRHLQKKADIHRSQILVVGTHADCLDEAKLREVRDALTKFLNSLFPSPMGEMLITNGCGGIIFEVNLRNPTKDDDDKFDCIRNIIKGKGEVIQIPLNFFAFEQDAMRKAAENVNVLTLDECVQIGDEYTMSRNDVCEALKYLHRNNVFLYFEKILPDLVFLDPTVPLNFVNAVVDASYGALTLETKNLCASGMITGELLQHEKFLQHKSMFCAGPFSPQNAIDLFMHFHIIAPVGQKPLDAPDTKPTKYLMMCLLPEEVKGKIDAILCQYCSASPLWLRFDDNGSAPLGVFGNTVSCLLSKYECEISGDPTIARNIVTLTFRHLHVRIALVNSTSHFLVCINAGRMKKEKLHEACLEVRSTILEAIGDVTEMMQLDLQVEPAFRCTCASTPEHAAEIDPKPTCPDSAVTAKSSLVCSKTDVLVGNLNPDDLLWIQGWHKNGSRTSETTTDVPEFPQQVFRLAQKRGLAILVTCDYEGTGIPPLSSTNGDADEMRKTFEQFDYDIHQLKNGAATEHAITALLKQASDYLSRYGGPRKNRDGEKKVIIFAFSGHGTSCGTSEDQIKTNGGELLSLREQIMLPLVTHPEVREIPKLFFIDACRGSDHLQKKKLDKGYLEVETNFRIDYATIPDHKAYAGTYVSFWMPVLASKLRETDAAFSSVIDDVNEEIHVQKETLQQPEAVSRLSGTLKLYYKK